MGSMFQRGELCEPCKSKNELRHTKNVGYCNQCRNRWWWYSIHLKNGKNESKSLRTTNERIATQPPLQIYWFRLTVDCLKFNLFIVDVSQETQIFDDIRCDLIPLSHYCIITALPNKCLNQIFNVAQSTSRVLICQIVFLDKMSF